MSYATNVGKAIALQRPRREDYWMRRLADDIQAKEAAAAKKKEKDEAELASLMDIKLDYSKYLPAWAKEIGKEYANMISNVAKLRQENPNVSNYLLKQEVLNARQRMNSYIVGNESAREYLKNDNIYKPANLLAKMTSTDSDLNELSQMSNPQFYNITPTGGFSYNPVSNKEPQIQFGKSDIIGKPTGKSLTEYGRTWGETVSVYSDEAKERAYKELRNNPSFIARKAIDFGAENPENRQQPGESRDQYFERINPLLNAEAQRIAKEMEPTKEYKWDIIAERAGAGGKDKEPYVVKPKIIKATVNTDQGPVTVRRLYAAIPNINKTVTLSLNDEFIIADKNQRIPKEMTGAINFKPNGVISQWSDIDGRFKLYVVGDAIESIENPQPITTEYLLNELEKTNPEVYARLSSSNRKMLQSKSNKFMIPYESSGIGSLIEASNTDLTPFTNDWDLLKTGEYLINDQDQIVPGKPVSKKATGIRVPTTQGEALDMARRAGKKGVSKYTQAQEDGIKRVMDANGISREEAIQALKDAKKL